MMENNLRAIQKDYENYLVALQMEKKNIKKYLSKIDSIATKNAELGIEIDSQALKNEKEALLIQVEKDIVKAKKVIHRLGKCISIMLEDVILEEAEEVIFENPVQE